MTETAIAAADFAAICRLLEQRSAIALGPGKEYLVTARLEPLAREHDGGFAGLVARLRCDAEGSLAQRVVEAMTTNETLFFRDGHPFDALRDHVLPDVLERRAAQRTLGVWCAAASTGQEPYSVAMVLDEVLRDRPGWTVDLLATDLDEQVLERTRQGTYSQLEVNRGLPVQLLLKHFSRVGTQWQVEDRLRTAVRTRAVNLAAPLPVLGAFDVVLLRNVLIYFSPEAKRQVLDRVRRLLRPGGWLFLGGAETTLTIDPDGWQPVAVGTSTAYRRSTS